MSDSGREDALCMYTTMELKEPALWRYRMAFPTPMWNESESGARTPSPYQRRLVTALRVRTDHKRTSSRARGWQSFVALSLASPSQSSNCPRLVHVFARGRLKHILRCPAAVTALQLCTSTSSEMKSSAGLTAAPMLSSMQPRVFLFVATASNSVWVVDLSKYIDKKGKDVLQRPFAHLPAVVFPADQPTSASVSQTQTQRTLIPSVASGRVVILPNIAPDSHPRVEDIDNCELASLAWTLRSPCNHLNFTGRYLLQMSQHSQDCEIMLVDSIAKALARVQPINAGASSSRSAIGGIQRGSFAWVHESPVTCSMVVRSRRNTSEMRSEDDSEPGTELRSGCPDQCIPLGRILFLHLFGSALPKSEVCIFGDASGQVLWTTVDRDMSVGRAARIEHVSDALPRANRLLSLDSSIVFLGLVHTPQSASAPSREALLVVSSTGCVVAVSTVSDMKDAAVESSHMPLSVSSFQTHRWHFACPVSSVCSVEGALFFVSDGELFQCYISDSSGFLSHGRLSRIRTAGEVYSAQTISNSAGESSILVVFTSGWVAIYSLTVGSEPLDSGADRVAQVSATRAQSIASLGLAVKQLLNGITQVSSEQEELERRASELNQQLESVHTALQLSRVSASEPQLLRVEIAPTLRETARHHQPAMDTVACAMDLSIVMHNQATESLLLSPSNVSLQLHVRTVAFNEQVPVTSSEPRLWQLGHAADSADDGAGSAQAADGCTHLTGWSRSLSFVLPQHRLAERSSWEFSCQLDIPSFEMLVGELNLVFHFKPSDNEVPSSEEADSKEASLSRVLVGANPSCMASVVIKRFEVDVLTLMRKSAVSALGGASLHPAELVPVQSELWLSSLLKSTAATSESAPDWSAKPVVFRHRVSMTNAVYASYLSQDQTIPLAGQLQELCVEALRQIVSAPGLGCATSIDLRGHATATVDLTLGNTSKFTIAVSLSPIPAASSSSSRPLPAEMYVECLCTRAQPAVVLQLRASVLRRLSLFMSRFDSSTAFAPKPNASVMSAVEQIERQLSELTERNRVALGAADSESALLGTSEASQLSSVAATATRIFTSLRSADLMF